MSDDIILMGIPRSGTTLACKLLNEIENVVALMEPLSPADFIGCTDSTIIEKLEFFFTLNVSKR